MPTARPDPPQPRFIPDPELVARAHNFMLDGEPDQVRFVRQRWEDAFGALRVSIDSLRDIHPTECHQLSEADRTGMHHALDLLTRAYTELDDMGERLLGWPMIGVLHGQVSSHAELDRIIGDDKT
jgi:hypothetical protein